MEFVKIPNLPGKPVGLVVIDGRISGEIEKNLITKGISVLKTQRYPFMYEAVSFHPDIMLHHIGENRIVYAPGSQEKMLRFLEAEGFELIPGETVLTSSYPGNIAYNAARVGTKVIHNTKFTDPLLKKELEKVGAEFIHVKQGYAKCSISVVDENSLITSDAGIAKAARQHGIEVLLLDQDQNIILPGINCGFIGGSTGLLSKNEWAVTGKLENIKAAGQIAEFLMKKGIQPVELSAGPVMDIGSILPLKE